MHWQQHHALLLDSRLSGVSSRQNSPAVSVTFSGFAAPARREMSIVDVNEGSFELSAKAEKLRFFTNKILDSPEELGRRYASDLAHQVAPSSVKALTSRILPTDELYGLPIGTESPRGISALVSRLVTVLPGIRLEDKLLASGAETHQRIADTLASHGYMNTRVLNILRTSEIEYLDLSASIGDEGGLNLDSQDVFHVFSKPNSFLFLSEINLANSEIKEADLLHLQNLPRLARLWLASSGIGNEAIFYLTPLKRSLTDLDIAFNSNIDDDAIPALLVLTKLQYLVFQGTCITMVGLRRLARTLKEQKRDMEVEVPRRCEEYISKLSNQYLIQPDPPLITDPEDVSSLTTAAIIRNLTAHSQSGSAKDESERLALRLRSLLETREADLLAKALILQQPLE
ncbi:hypothetical protein BC835DRAFT_1480366 [Cytidiella melzeri]|nr:hypothetical protein BC835DRAFT_1480366 [Cytidiella melzeri]